MSFLNMNFSKYTRHYKQNLMLAAPVVLSQLGQVVVQLVDNAMVGRLGATQLAAASFAGTVFFLLFIFATGLSLGITPLVGEMYSKGEHKRSSEYLQNAVLVYFVAGLIIFAVQYALVPFLHYMGQPEEVVLLAVPYYKYLVWSIIPFMLFAAFKQFLEGVGNTAVSMVIILVANLINVLLNYVFIYGNWGAPQMGAAGAGLATMISRICMPLFMLIYFVNKDRLRRYFSFFNWSRFSWRYVRSLLSVGFPISLQMLMEGAAFCVTAIMMGWIGTNSIAGNQIATITANFTFMMVLGIASATTIRVSHEFGSGNLKELRLAAVASYHIGMAYNIITATLLITFRNYIPLIFTSDPEVIATASYLLIFVAVFQISDGLQCISIGILRGMQDVKSIMRIAFFSYIVINIPLGYFCAFVLNWGAGGLWLGFIVGLSVAAILLAARFTRLYARLRRADK